jgi:hypothetical protein
MIRRPVGAAAFTRLSVAAMRWSSSIGHDLLGSWVAGWALARDLVPPVPAYGGFRVDVGLPDQTARYVFRKASQELRRASAEIQDPNVFLKICAAPDLVTPLLADGRTIKPLGFS